MRCGEMSIQEADREAAKTEAALEERARREDAEDLAIRHGGEQAMWINVYLEDRRWGGAEEGGWWYDCGRVVRKHDVTALEDNTIKALIRDEQAWCDRENSHRRSDISSVLSEGAYTVVQEEREGEDYPAVAPHYE